MKTSGIYKIVHQSGRHYIGSAVNVSARLRAHRNHLKRGSHHNSHLQNTWNRDGASAFSFEPLEAVERERLAEREQFWLDHYRPNVFNIGRFVGSPMLGVRREFSAEWRRKMSEAAKRRGCGQTFGEMSEQRTGLKKSDAHKRAIGNANRIAHARPETKERMRAAALAREAAKREKRLAEAV